jgi:nicotinamidase-related amidase
MVDALLLIDVINEFDHDDGDKLLASMRERLPAMLAVIERARHADVPVVYVNNSEGRWDSDAPALVHRAVDGRGGSEVAQIAPRDGDRFVLKPRYSAFDHTPLVLVLRELRVERIVVVGAATEMCVVQSAIDARELGFKVTVLADACATVDEEMERLSLVYLQRVAGAFVHDQDEWEPGRE